MVFVNAGKAIGKQDSNYAGLSSVHMPFVGALGNQTKDSNEEGMSVVNVDMTLVEEAETNYKVRKDIAGERWHYTYRHQAEKL